MRLPLLQISSPQLRQALDSLTGALNTENFNSIFANFGLDPAAGADEAARGDSTGAFVRAVQQRADDSTGTGGTDGAAEGAADGADGMEED